jgi:hypothetical protein
MPKKILFLVPALPAVAGISAVGAGIKNSGIFANPKLDRADSFCKIFVILCSFKNIHSPIDQTAKKESGTHRGQR